MFGAEPLEKWTAEESAEFEIHVAAQLCRVLVKAGWATAPFLITILAIIPFFAGHSLHSDWETMGKYLAILAMGELLWFLMRWLLVYSSWQSAREVRREITDKE